MVGKVLKSCSVNPVEIGGAVLPGEYRLYSAFKRVRNFVCRELLVSFVTESIGSGPVNIVFSNNDLPGVETVKITSKQLSFGSFRFDLETISKYDPYLRLQGGKQGYIKENIDVMHRTLIAFASLDSLVFLLDDKRCRSFTTPHKKKLCDIFINARDAIVSGDFSTGIRSIAGVGIGLTPAGDDFLTGMLWGLALGAEESEFNRIRDCICRETRTGNLISRHQILSAARQQYSGVVKQLLTELLLISPEDVCASVLKLLHMGSTSGADAGTGLVIALKLLYR